MQENFCDFKTLMMSQDSSESDEKILKELSAKKIVPEYLERAILEILQPEFSGQKKSLAQMIDEFKKKKSAVLENVNELIETFKTSNVNIGYNQVAEAYLLRYFLINLYKIWTPLTDLLVRDKLFFDLDVLDVGTGPGSCIIGLIEFYAILARNNPDIQFEIRVGLLERNATFLNYAEKMFEVERRNVPHNLKIERKKCNSLIDVAASTQLSELGQYDIITCSNFFTKIEHYIPEEHINETIGIIDNLKKNLNKNGSLIIIEPGKAEHNKAIKEAVARLKEESKQSEHPWNEYSPCLNVWHNKETCCKCFGVCRAFWKTPKIFEHFNFSDPGLVFTYKVLRIDGERKYPVMTTNIEFIELKDVGKSLENTINVKGFIGAILDGKGESKYFSICDGTLYGAKSVKLWLSESAKNKMEFSGSINGGELVVVRGTHVVWNECYNNYQLKCDENTKIEFFC